jgi:hypothetical protein
VWELLVWAHCHNDSNSFAVDTDAFDWKLACVCIDDQYEFWNKKHIQMKPLLALDVHDAPVNAVHLMNVSISVSDGKIIYQLLCSRTPKVCDTLGCKTKCNSECN